MTTERYERKILSVWRLIVQSRDVISRVREDELIKYGITFVEARALFILDLLGDRATPAEVSRYLFREHNTITALMNRMQNKGLITKGRNTENKKTWRISLTEKGKEAYNQSSIRESINDIFSTLTEDELDQMISCLMKVSTRANKYVPDMWIPPIPSR